MEMKRLAILAVATLLAVSAFAQGTPKREFRGAWLHIVGNQKIKTMTTKQVKDWISSTLDTLESLNCNAVIFQVRPQADAFYDSPLEPWTRFLTGVQGKAPVPLWDPLEFAIEECHRRGMELHAWLNPYRVTSNDKETLCKGHLYFKHPEWFVRYGKQIYFDPGVPACREHTVKVIRDIVTRYDVDAVHFDDYFYPYPIKGQDFPDGKSFAKYHGDFSPERKADWRRNNVTQLIREVNEAVKSVKPWVRFGISPFGVHRNRPEDPHGSATRALSTYNDLYADIPLWCREGYIDYNVPQLYWKIGHKLADYETLIHWWNDGNFGGHLYIGQDLGTFTEPDIDNPSTTQMAAKMRMVRELPGVHGNVWWPGWYLATGERHGHETADSLRTKYQKYKSLIPPYTRIDDTAPAAVKSVRTEGRSIIWETAGTDDPMQEPAFFVVYRFGEGEKTDIGDSSRIVAVTREKSITVPSCGQGCRHRYVVTVTDHCWNESEPSPAVIL
ncbi:MAG: family 10 glycosylhydrolase [Bacteroidales bacterium]|nr:family 10 glycosylhydrolase [Bacteroidales bacterium]